MASTIKMRRTGGGFHRKGSFKVSGKPAAISVTRSHACADLLVEHAQRIDKGAHFAAHGNDAQANLIAHQHHRAWGLLNRYQKVSCLRFPVKRQSLFLLQIQILITCRHAASRSATA